MYVPRDGLHLLSVWSDSGFQCWCGCVDPFGPLSADEWVARVSSPTVVDGYPTVALSFYCEECEQAIEIFRAPDEAVVIDVWPAVHRPPAERGPFVPFHVELRRDGHVSNVLVRVGARVHELDGAAWSKLTASGAWDTFRALSATWSDSSTSLVDTVALLAARPA